VDDFRKFQKCQCPHLFGKRRGNRSLYGCECCMWISLPKFKKYARRKARVWLKEEDRKLFSE